MSSSIRVLVCGTNYGRYYLQAIKRGDGSLQLAGILARGSDRSARLARRYQVPLYRSPDQLPDSIELACAAMSSAANDVVLQLLERGIHLLCEHPQRPAFLREAMALAARQRVRLHVNGHFPDLPAPRAFIRRCGELRRQQPVRLLDLVVTDRSLYAGIDIIARALGDHRLASFGVSRRARNFLTLQGEVADVPATIRVQASGGADEHLLEDGSPEYLFDCHLTAVFDTGTLTMPALAGPVVWSRNSGSVQDPGEQMWNLTGDDQAPSAEQYQEQRFAANLAALEQLAAVVREGTTPPDQSPEHLLGVSTAWEELGRLLTT